MSYFRQRFSPEEINQINEAIIAQDPAQKSSTHDDGGGGEDSSSSQSKHGDPRTDSEASSEESSEQSNSGTLILDATCFPQDIHFPTDIRLLYEAVCSAMRHLEKARDKRLTNTQKSLLNQARQAFLKYL